MPLFNQTNFLTEALESLLGQTYRDFRLIVVDDSNDTKSSEIAKEFASKDNRISYIKNGSHKGMIANWNTCFRYAGDADYFAWVSDHDFWHPEWLQTMISILDANPNVILTYPKTAYITTEGRRYDKKLSQHFSTESLTEAQRVRAVSKDARYFGKMVYGLFRANNLRRTGAFRRILFPDVILLHELCLQGDFKQVDKELWYLRRMTDFSIARQKKMLFVKRPWYIFLPWPIVNAFVLAWNTALRPDAGNRQHRILGLKLSLMYLQRWLARLGDGSWLGSYHEWRKGKKPWMQKLMQRIKQPKKDQINM
jgi:glycosyltransferase involved in cell wall biosynthesis